MKPYLFVIALAATLFHSCGRQNSVEVVEIEKLQTALGANATTLQIDISIFEDRVNAINQDLTFFRKNYTDTLTLELGMQIDKYKALRKIYEGQMKSYKFCVKEQLELETQLSNLKEDFVNGAIGKQEFKTHFSKEKEDVLALIDKSKDVKKRLYEVEPEFIRLTKLVTEVLDGIKLPQ